jgi:hypothetical protein
MNAGVPASYVWNFVCELKIMNIGNVKIFEIICNKYRVERMLNYDLYTKIK